jgi:hypothetical protein
MPTKQYIALLDIKMVIREWQDLSVSDTIALMRIDKILTTLVNESK